MNTSVQLASAETFEPGFLSWVSTMVHGHRSRLIGYARRRGLDAEEALDCVQDAFHCFLLLPEAKSVVGVADDSAKLLNVILRNIVWNRRSTQSRRERILASVTSSGEGETVKSSDELIAEAEQMAVVRGCIAHMARLQRAVIELSLIDDQSGEDIAKAVGTSPGHVRVLLHRARAKMRTCTTYGGSEPSGPDLSAREPLALDGG